MPRPIVYFAPDGRPFLKSLALPFQYRVPMTAATKVAPLPPTATQPASGVFITTTITTPATATTAVITSSQPHRAVTSPTFPLWPPEEPLPKPLIVRVPLSSPPETFTLAHVRNVMMAATAARPPAA